MQIKRLKQLLDPVRLRGYLGLLAATQTQTNAQSLRLVLLESLHH